MSLPILFSIRFIVYRILFVTFFFDRLYSAPFLFFFPLTRLDATFFLVNFQCLLQFTTSSSLAPLQFEFYVQTVDLLLQLFQICFLILTVSPSQPIIIQLFISLTAESPGVWCHVPPSLLRLSSLESAGDVLKEVRTC